MTDHKTPEPTKIWPYDIDTLDKAKCRIRILQTELSVLLQKFYRMEEERDSMRAILKLVRQRIADSGPDWWPEMHEALDNFDEIKLIKEDEEES